MTERWSDPERARRWDTGHLRGNPIRGPHLGLVLELLEGAPEGWCLDLGSGSGLVAELVLDRFPNLSVLGVDASPAMLSIASERLARFGSRAETVQADLATGVAALPGVPQPCVAAFAVQALHHLDRSRLAELLAWIRDRLQPGGLLVISDPILIPSAALYPLFRRAKAHLGWRWNPEAFEEYGNGLSEGHDRLIPLEDYLALVRESRFDTTCLDVSADRVLMAGLVAPGIRSREISRPVPSAGAGDG